jgi:hypothetical protein
MVNGCSVWKDVGGIGQILIQDTSLTFAYREWIKPRKNLTTADVLAEM